MPRHSIRHQRGAAPGRLRLTPRHEHSITHHRGAAPAFIVALLLAAVASPVAADPILSPPWGLTGEVENGVVRLFWNATGQGEEAYNVYRDGVLVATTGMPTYTDAQTAAADHRVYVVTALHNGTESPPSRPWTPNSPVEHVLPPDCELIVTSSNLSQPPFIFWGIDQTCQRAWENYIEYMTGLCEPPGCTDED